MWWLPKGGPQHLPQLAHFAAHCAITIQDQLKNRSAALGMSLFYAPRLSEEEENLLKAYVLDQ